MTTASAPGKIILVGEHAVVYGRPAIAAPVWEVTATATVTDRPPGVGCLLLAPDIGLRQSLVNAPANQPLALVTRLVLAALGAPADPDWQIELQSTIPIAGGLGSGAALSAALVRAVFAHLGYVVDPEQVRQFVYESERLYHGAPSGIDNTVIAFGQPIWFVKGAPPTPFVATTPLTLAIADSGIPAPTKAAVADVRRGWQANPAQFEAWFDAIGALVHATRRAIEAGDPPTIGRLLDENQMLLAKLGVSAPPLERLITAARGAGALGAKLSGGGRGGNIIALVEPSTVEAVRAALLDAGARRVIVTTI